MNENENLEQPPKDRTGSQVGVERIVSCDFCKEEGQNIFDFETLDHWMLGWGSGAITKDNASYSKNAVFIDRGYLRMVDVDDSQCMDHGDKRKINFCPFCGNKLDS